MAIHNTIGLKYQKVQFREGRTLTHAVLIVDFLICLQKNLSPTNRQ